MNIYEQISGGIIGLVVGDALGVPAEFKSRDSYHITGMTGYGTHNQPPGTWSDDSSLALCTLHSLIGGYEPEDIMNNFVRWLNEAYMTAHDEVFDIGGATNSSILSYVGNKDYRTSGMADELSNGNGSLMRILPASIYFHKEEPDEIIAKTFEVSKFTHAHIRSMLCCAYYSLLVKAILSGTSLTEGMNYASEQLKQYVPEEEKDILKRIMSGYIINECDDNISSSGYVVHTLEATLWCCHTTTDFASAVLKAVNLGNDTDTVGAVTGGLAGLIYGKSSVPREWIETIAKIEDIKMMTDLFINAL